MTSPLVTLGVPVGIHLHNTRNTGFANAFAALEAGATSFDASVGGIGGCPFAPRATGNIATEDLVYLFHGEGVETGIELGALVYVAKWLESRLGRELETRPEVLLAVLVQEVLHQRRPDDATEIVAAGGHRRSPRIPPPEVTSFGKEARLSAPNGMSASFGARAAIVVSTPC